MSAILFALLAPSAHAESVIEFKTTSPVAIFVDVLMPQVDGWKVIEMLKGDPATASIPVFMLSILEERHKAKEHKAAGFITKPLDSHKLKEALSGIHAVKAEEAAWTIGRKGEGLYKGLRV